MITVSQNFLDSANKADQVPVYLAEIQIAENTFARFISAPHSTIDEPISLAECSPVSGSLDIVERKIKTGSMDLIFVNDGQIRDLFSSITSKGRPVQLKLGFADLDESDFVLTWTGQIDEVLPEADIITLECIEAAGMLEGYVNHNLGWPSTHPLKAIRSVFKLAFVPDELIDLASFDPSLYPDMEHVRTASGYELIHQVTVAGEKIYKVKGPASGSALEIASALASMLNGAIHTNREGKISFIRFDKDKAPVDHWTEHDFADFEQLSTFETLANQCMINLGGTLGPVPFERNDTDSQDKHAHPDGDAFIKDMVFDWPYVSQAYFSPINLWYGIPAGFPVAITNNDSAMAGVSDSITDGVADPVPMSNDRPLYILAEGKEIIKCTDFEIITYRSEPRVEVGDVAATSADKARKPGIVHVTAGQRAMFGTDVCDRLTASADATELKGSCVDCTAAVVFAEQFLERFGDGCPFVSLSTPLSKISVELGDFVTIDESQIFYDGSSGLNDQTVWEVLGKEIIISDSGCYINWELAKVLKRPALQTTVVVQHTIPKLVNGVDLSSSVLGLIQDPYVFSGLGLSSGLLSGLTVDVGAGCGIGAQGGSLLIDDDTIDVLDNKDNYILFSSSDSSLIMAPVDHGELFENKDKSLVLLGKVSTASGAITSIDDLRQTKPISGEKLEAGSGVLSNFDSVGNFSGQIAASQIPDLPSGLDTSVIEGRLDDIEADYLQSNDIDDLITQTELTSQLPDLSGYATTTLLNSATTTLNNTISGTQTTLNNTISGVQSSLNGLISTNQTNINTNSSTIASVQTVANGALQDQEDVITARHIHARRSGIAGGIVSNPDFYIQNANTLPENWYLWNTGPSYPQYPNNHYALESDGIGSGNCVHVWGNDSATPVLISDGSPVNYGDQVRIEALVKSGSASNVGINPYIHIYLYYPMAGAGVDFTGVYFGASGASFTKGESTTTSEWDKKVWTVEIPDVDDPIWANNADAGATPYIGGSLEARITFRTSPHANGYDWKVSHMSAQVVGFGESDFMQSTQDRITNIETLANGALQDSSDVITNSHLQDNIVSAATLTSSASARLLPSSTSFNTLSSSVSTNTSNIATKASTSSVNTLSSSVSTNTADIATLQGQIPSPLNAIGYAPMDFVIGSPNIVDDSSGGLNVTSPYNNNTFSWSNSGSVSMSSIGLNISSGGGSGFYGNFGPSWMKTTPVVSSAVEYSEGSSNVSYVVPISMVWNESSGGSSPNGAYVVPETGTYRIDACLSAIMRGPSAYHYCDVYLLAVCFTGSGTGKDMGIMGSKTPNSIPTSFYVPRPQLLSGSYHIDANDGDQLFVGVQLFGNAFTWFRGGSYGISNSDTQNRANSWARISKIG